MKIKFKTFNTKKKKKKNSLEEIMNRFAKVTILSPKATRTDFGYMQENFALLYCEISYKEL